MKKHLCLMVLVLGLLAWAWPANAATRKISAMPENTAPASDVEFIIDDGTPTYSRASLANIASHMPAITAPSLTLSTTPLPVTSGGWGLATLTPYSLYAGNGTSAPTAVGVGTTGQILGGVTGGYPSWLDSLPNTALPPSGTWTLTGDLVFSGANIGLGVTPKAWQASDKVFQIGGLGSIAAQAAATASGYVVFGNNYYNSGGNKRIINDQASRYYQIDGAHFFETTPADVADSAISWEQILKLQNNAAIFGQHDGGDILYLERYSSGSPYAILQAGSADSNVLEGWQFFVRDSTGAAVAALTIDGMGNTGHEVVPKTDWSPSFTAVQFGGTGAIWNNTAAAVSSEVAIMHNAYYTGTWKYIMADEASRVVMQDGGVRLEVAPAGTADGALNWITALFVNTSGNTNLNDHALYGSAAASGVFDIRATSNATKTNSLIAFRTTIDSLNILGIQNSSIFRYDTDNDGAGMWVNMVGYLGGITRNRDTFIGDGKQNVLSGWDGSDKILTHNLNSIDIKNADTPPSTSITDGVRLYAEDVTGSSELKVRDEAGNITQLSAHNYEKIAPNVDHPMPWVMYSENAYLGKRADVDLVALALAVQELTGRTDIIKFNDTAKSDWASDQAIIKADLDAKATAARTVTVDELTAQRTAAEVSTLVAASKASRDAEVVALAADLQTTYGDAVPVLDEDGNTIATRTPTEQAELETDPALTKEQALAQVDVAALRAQAEADTPPITPYETKQPPAWLAQRIAAIKEATK